MSKHTYYRNGIEISREEALDKNHAMRDGVVMRSNMTFMDSMESRYRADRAAERAARAQRDADSHTVSKFVDGAGNSHQLFNRPGYRLRSRDFGADSQAQTIADARAAYELDLVNSWKGDASSNPTKGTLGGAPDDDDDDFGTEGAAGKQEWKTGPDEDDDEQQQWGAGERARRRRRKRRSSVEEDAALDAPLCTISDHRSDRYIVNDPPRARRPATDVASLEAERSRLTEPLYDSIDRATSEAWKNPTT